MKKILTILACSSAFGMQAQSIKVNLSDGSQAIYEKENIKNVEFVPSEYKGKIHYATTDMSFAEFFAGEINQKAETLLADGVDVVTSATSGKASRFTACVASEDGSQINGVKAVSVSMTDEIFNALTDEQKARFTFVDDTVFASSKRLLADGSFSAYTSKPVEMTATSVSLSSGSSTNWGNYVVSLGIDRYAIPAGNVQGAVVTTSNGQKFALVPLFNLWLNTSEFAFCVKDFTEPHGNHPAYNHTAGLQGKTITNLTYYLKDKDNVSIPCNVYVKRQTIASISVDGAAIAGINPTVYLKMDNIPNDANYTLAAVKKGSGRAAVTLAEDKYNFANGILNITDTASVNDIYSVTFNSDKYISIGSTIKFGTDIMPTELQQNLSGTYVELFSERGITASKWDSLWIAECQKHVGVEQAEATATMLKNSMLGTLTGAEATKKFGDCSNGFTPDMQFSCHFLQSVDKFIFEGTKITGLDADGKELFSHNYIKVGYNADLDFHFYKSVDGNEDEFKFFYMRSDNPKDTYHIEFRYGSKADELLGFCTGDYAFWMAAGVLEGDEKQCMESIRLFVKENLTAE